MNCPKTRCEYATVPFPTITVIPTIVSKTTHGSCVVARIPESSGRGSIAFEECRNLLDVREVAQSVLAGRSDGQIAVNSNIRRTAYLGGVFRQGQAVPGTDQNQPFAVLRNPESSHIDHFPGQAYLITRLNKGFDKLFQKEPLRAYCQPFDVFEDEVRWPQFGHDANEIAYETIAGVFQSPLAHHRKALTGWATEYHVDSTTTDTRPFQNFSSGKIRNRLWQNGAMGEVELVDCTMNGINFDRSDNIEACLFEAETEAPGSCK